MPTAASAASNASSRSNGTGLKLPPPTRKDVPERFQVEQPLREPSTTNQRVHRNKSDQHAHATGVNRAVRCSTV